MKSEKTYLNERHTKWLFLVALLLSVFSFSGYSTSSETLAYRVHTELVLSKKRINTARGISFSKALNYGKPKTNLSSKNHLSGALWSYNQLVKAKLKQKAKFSILKKNAESFRRTKTIPQNSEEDPFITSLG
jgi:hypothetical protein